MPTGLYPKPAAQIAAAILEAQGVRHAVVSPGSRNSPLLHALSLREKITLEVVADERSAAFVALGIASTSRRPVVLCCTSGTALLDYAPAVAEAYYARVPLIVISADRPAAWIDQADSQTIHQPGALAGVVKHSYNISDSELCGKDARWFLERTVNDACLEAQRGLQGPVHLNISLEAPLQPIYGECGPVKLIRAVQPAARLPQEAMAELADRAAGRKIMVVAGPMRPDDRLNRAMESLSAFTSCVVLAENLANLHTTGIITNIDAALSVLRRHRESEEAGDTPGATYSASVSETEPDLVIYTGGPIVSAELKEYLRSLSDTEFWRVGLPATLLEDTFRQLDLSIEADPVLFFPTFAKLLARCEAADADYRDIWYILQKEASDRHIEFLRTAPWSELKALGHIFPRIPENCNLHLSNGTAVRYGLLFDTRRIHALFANRGCSGIEGSTSTAVGSAICYRRPTLLITGDLSFSYDIGAMALQFIPANFKVILLNNSGGGIFRFIRSTREIPGRERLLCAPPNLPAAKLCEAYGWRYSHASTEEELRVELRPFLSCNDAPSLLEIEVDPQTTAETFRRYLSL